MKHMNSLLLIALCLTSFSAHSQDPLPAPKEGYKDLVLPDPLELEKKAPSPTSGAITMECKAPSGQTFKAKEKGYDQCLAEVYASPSTSQPVNVNVK